MTQTTPSTSAQGPVAPITPERLAEVRERFDAVPHSEPDSLTGHVKGMLALIDSLSASPSPAASPASPSGVREAALHLAFEIGYCWRGMLVGQTLEDSRAVSRTLGADIFDGLNIDASEVPGFETADIGIYHAKRAIRKALASLASDATPAPTSGSEDGGELHFIFDGLPGPEGPRFVEVEDATGRSVNAGEWRMRADGYAELIVRTAPVSSREEPGRPMMGSVEWDNEQARRYRLAQPASSPAGVREALQAAEPFVELLHSVTNEKRARAIVWKALKQVRAALSSSAAPAGEPVVWRYRLFRETRKWTYETCKAEVDCRRNANYEIEALYTHPAPATVEMRDAELLHDFHRQTKQADAARKALSEIIHTTTDEAVLKLARAGIAAVKAAALAPATEGRKS